MFCKRCGASLGNKDIYCSKCGALISSNQLKVLREEQERNNMNPQMLIEKYGNKVTLYSKKNKDNNVLLFILVIVGLLVIIGLVVLVISINI